MLDRRDLIKLSAVAGAAALVEGCQAPSGPAGSGPAETTETEGQASQRSDASFELSEWTITDLSRAMEEGKLTSAEIVGLYADRIAAVDHAGPELRSVLVINPDAAAIAQERDEEREAGNIRGPLHGVPVLLKDNLDTGDRMATTAGSLALAGTFAAEDSTVARKLREAGAIILGKTNLSEWANFRSERSSSGWSGVGGQTKNPYVLNRNPCGSSSGSGVAVAANLCAAAIGTETDGSVVCPSNANGIVGVKPTVGLVSRTGIVPIAESQDTAGPMARTVQDAALMLQAIAGEDPSDPAHRGGARPAGEASDLAVLTTLDPAALDGARVGVWRERLGFHEKVDAAIEEALTVLRDAGAEVIDPIEMPTLGEVGDHEYEVLLYEFKDGLDRYLSGRAPDLETRSLEALVAFNLEHRDREMPFFEQEIFEKAVEKGPLTDSEYLKARETCVRLTRTEGLDRVMREHRLDALVAPTGGPAWVTDFVNGDHFGGGSSRAAAVSGYPNVTVPAGFVHGLPVGMSFIGKAWSEVRLLNMAFAYEQASKVRRPPEFLPKV